MSRLFISEIDEIVAEARGWNAVMGQQDDSRRDAIIADNQILIIRLLADIAKGMING